MKKILWLVLSFSLASASAEEAKVCEVYIIEGHKVTRKESKKVQDPQACMSLASGFVQRSKAELDKAVNQVLAGAETPGDSIHALEEFLSNGGTTRRYPVACFGETSINPLQVKVPFVIRGKLPCFNNRPDS